MIDILNDIIDILVMITMFYLIYEEAWLSKLTKKPLKYFKLLLPVRKWGVYVVLSLKLAMSWFLWTTDHTTYYTVVLCTAIIITFLTVYRHERDISHIYLRNMLSSSDKSNFEVGPKDKSSEGA